MKRKTETALHPVTEIETTAIDAMKGAVMTGEGTTVVLVEMIIAIVTGKEAQTATATGKGHDDTRTTVPTNATTGKTGNRRVEGVKTANVLVRLIVGPLRLRTQSLSPKGSAKRLVGMLQPQDTSNILLCKPSKLVNGEFYTSHIRAHSLSGLFNLPGANRSHGPQIIGFGAHPPIPTGLVPNTNLARQSRRLYLGSITSLADEDNIALFFNAKMREMGLSQGPGNPVLAVQVNREKNYAFVEFRSAEDATAGMQLDGTVFLDGPLRVRRPHDYAGPETLTSYNTMLPSTVPDSANKIFVGGLPPYLNEDQVVELLKSFGELKSFNLVREHGNGPSKVCIFSKLVAFSNCHFQGFAFFEYVDPSVTDHATTGLNGMELGDKKLLVQRASVGAKGPMFANLPPEAQEAMEIPAPIRAIDVTSTVADARILLMLNMVTTDDLYDEMEYSEILDDVREECTRYGEVEDLRIPRPVKRDKSKWGSSEPGALSAAEASKVDEAAGVGRVYVKYRSSDGANMALKALAGRSFGGRSIIATLIADDAQTTPPLEIVFSNNTVAKV